MNQMVLNEFKAGSGAWSLPILRKLWLIWQIYGLNTDGAGQLSGYLKSIFEICIKTDRKFTNPSSLKKSSLCYHRLEEILSQKGSLWRKITLMFTQLRTNYRWE